MQHKLIISLFFLTALLSACSDGNKKVSSKPKWVIDEKKKFYLPLANKYEKRFISTFNNNDLYYKDDFSSDTLFISNKSTTDNLDLIDLYL